jgi:DNA-binding IscR family transcriptional regulator
MADPDNIPDTYLNKAQIAVKYSISRVTVDRYLKKLEEEGRLFPIKVQQGKRTLYSYDPNDLDEALTSLLQKNKKQTIVQRNVSVLANVQTQSQIELLRMNLQNAEKRILEKDELISDLKEQRDKKDRQIEVLQSLITDQRPSVITSAPEAPKPAPVAPETKALPTELDPDHPDHPDNVVSLPTAKVEKAIKEVEQEVREDIDDATLEDVMDHFDPMNSAEMALLDEEIAENKKAKDAEPAPQSNQTKEESTQPSEEATAKEQRRDNITPKPTPAPVKRSLWQKLKDNW